MNFRFLFKNTYSIIFWLLLWVLQSLLMSEGPELTPYLIKNVVIVALQFLAVCINLKWLYPAFFERKNYVLYILLCIVIVYLIFTLSFPVIDIAFSTFYPNFIIQDSIIFSFNFWEILSGSSFYSLALVSSLAYKLFKTNQEKESLNLDLKRRLINETSNETIVIKEGHKVHKVLIEEIYFVKGLKEYVVWHTKNKKIIALQTLSSIELNFKEIGLLRVHKSYIVNMKHVKSFEKNTLKVQEEFIPVGRAYKKNVAAIF